MRIKCEQCEQPFDPADRVSPIAKDGAIVQVKYCSVECKRKAGNARYYARHQARIKPINRDAIRARRSLAK